MTTVDRKLTFGTVIPSYFRCDFWYHFASKHDTAAVPLSVDTPNRAACTRLSNCKTNFLQHFFFNFKFSGFFYPLLKNVGLPSIFCPTGTKQRNISHNIYSVFIFTFSDFAHFPHLWYLSDLKHSDMREVLRPDCTFCNLMSINVFYPVAGVSGIFHGCCRHRESCFPS